MTLTSEEAKTRSFNALYVKYEDIVYKARMLYLNLSKLWPIEHSASGNGYKGLGLVIEDN